MGKTNRRRGTCLCLVMALLLCGCGSESAKSAVSYEDVSDKTDEAAADLKSGDVQSALSLYAKALRTNPVDLAAQIGLAKCQIELENYDMAATNLSSAAQIDGSNEEIYDLFLQMSEESSDVDYAREALDLAKACGGDEFLSKVPQAPTVGEASGSYEEKLPVTISAQDGADIYVTETSDDGSTISYTVSNGDTLTMTSGTTKLSIFCVVDGYPSTTTTARYVCSYDPSPVTFQDPVIEKIARKELEIGDSDPITDVDCEKVTSLYQSDLRSDMEDEDYDKLSIKSLEDLSYFPRLTQFQLEHAGKGLDYSPLAKCHRLTGLQIMDSSFSDLGAIEPLLPNLKLLNLAGDFVKDWSLLSKATKLATFSVAGDQTVDLSLIPNKKLLDTLYVNTKSYDSKTLNSFGNLTYLCLYVDKAMQIKIPGLKLPKLRTFSVSWWGDKVPTCGVDFSFMNNLPSLTDVYVYGLDSWKYMDTVPENSRIKHFYCYVYYELDVTEPENLQEDLQKKLPNSEIDTGYTG